MTREQAFEEAVRRFGDRAVVGHGRPVNNHTVPDCFYAGWKERDEWKWIGMGQSWEEALANVQEVILCRRDRLEFKKKNDKKSP